MNSHRTLRIASILAAALVATSAFADVKISNLPTGGALGGTEATPVVQSGTTIQTTPAAFATYTQSIAPAHSGDCTSAVGANALTCTKTNGVSFATSATTDTTNAANIASGTLPAGRLPALTGDCTTSVGTVATTCTKTNGVAFVASATTDTTNASNISSGTLSLARLASCLATQIPFAASASATSCSSNFTWNDSTTTLTLGGTTAAIKATVPGSGAGNALTLTATAAASGNSAGGALTLNSGTASGSGNGGNIVMTAGNSTTGNAGGFLLTTGSSTSGNEGNARISIPAGGDFSFGTDVDLVTPVVGLVVVGSATNATSSTVPVKVLNNQNADGNRAELDALNQFGDEVSYGITNHVNTTAPLTGGPNVAAYLNSQKGGATLIPLCLGTESTMSLCLDDTNQGVWLNGATGSSKGSGTLNAVGVYQNGSQLFGTGNGFLTFTGPATSTKTFTLPNASATILTSNAAVTVAQGGTGVATLTAHGVLIGEGTGNVVGLTALTADQILQGTAASDPQALSITNCGDSSHALAYSTTTHLFSCQSITGSGTSPGSPSTSIQYNNGGAFGGSADLVYNGTDTVTLGDPTSTVGLIVGGLGTTTSTAGDTLTIRGGTGGSVSGDGGLLGLRGGQANGSGNSGGIGISTSNGVGGNHVSGDINITTGQSVGSGKPGDILIQPGNASATGNGGNITLQAGNGAGGGTNGIVKIASGITSTGTTFTLGTGTGACATSSTLVGGVIAGKFTCTGTTGASTIVVNIPPPTANGWTCFANDQTTANTLRTSASTTTSATIAGTVNANDVISFGCVGY